MPDFPGQVSAARAGAIHSFGPSSMIGDGMILNRTATTTSANAANRAQYTWFFIATEVTVYKIAWENGATINGNVDVGIYNEAGTLLISSGSTAQSGASVVQVVDITDTVLPPGGYFMGIVSDSASATFRSCTLATEWLRLSGAQWEASAFPLPSTATMSTIASSVLYALSLLLRPEA